MRIMLLCNPQLVNSNYRSYQPLTAAAHRGGHELLRNEAGQALDPRTLLSCDVLHVHRVASIEAIALARRLREEGVGIVWDNDDDIAALPRSNPHYARLGARGRRERVLGIAEMVRLADVVTTPSEVLAAKYRDQGGADVRVLENYLPREFMGVGRVPHEGMVIACLAGVEHRLDYDQLGLRDALAQVLEAHPDVRLLTIGHGLGLDPARTEHIPLVSFLELARTLARADVGLAPLIDIPWNRARSNVKLKEYAAAGLAWLASPVGPYAGMGERQGGRLVPDDGWHEAIETLVADARARRKLAKRGAKWVKGESVASHAREWEAVLRDAAERARSRAGARTRRVA